MLKANHFMLSLRKTFIYCLILVLVPVTAQKLGGASAFRKPQIITLDETKQDKDNIRIAFGSCYGIFDKRSDIFETIASD